jgi:hypothetical protein
MWFSPEEIEDKRPGGDVLAAKLDGSGSKVSAGSAGNAKKSGLGLIKEGLCAFCQMQGWKPNL